ncbi:MAG TPA: BlaI/MecI/CopY family transcriptional regulator [Pirellulaceae bacterium]|nr:BlaI/MecI/CopY family transcriptional regulator [Pirellulaceae bacterium]
MARPKEEQPTAGELDVLKVLWDRGPSTVRDVMDVLNESRPRAYTSVMSLLNVMTDKGLLIREPQGRAFVYRPKTDRGRTLKRMVGDLLGRAFEGQASQLVAHLLDQSKPTSSELDEIRRTIEAYQKVRGS